MPKRSATLAELKNLGRCLLKARLRQGLTQKELAAKASVSQPRVSDIEKGEVLPTLPQLIRLAKALAVPVQWFLSGWVVPGTETPDFALQLEWLGVVDLLVQGAVVPGAFRPTEQVLALAVAGNEPNPRIIEAIPAVLAWNRWSPSLLRAYTRPRTSRASIRLAWLADVALTIHRATGFPGGCPQRKNLESFIGPLFKAKLPLTKDDLGRPGKESALPPVSKRWMISYDAPLSVFVERAQHLFSQLQPRRLSLATLTQRSDE
jgi:transcriptional regulator with XRE-family HTH domain